MREAWDAYDNRPLPPPQRREREWADKPEPLARMLQPRQDWTEQDFAAYRRGLAALVTEMDLAIGALIDWLREHAMLEDTLLVFSSDHGDFAGDHGITHKSAAFYDPVMRVPLVMHWPHGLGAQRRECHELMEMVDVLPTLLGLCGAPTPEAMVGQSLAHDLLAGREPTGREDVLAFHGPGMAMLRTPTHKYLRYEPEGTEVLYDLDEAAGGEYVNHAPNAGYADVLDRMRQRLLARSLTASASRQPRVHPF